LNSIQYKRTSFPNNRRNGNALPALQQRGFATSVKLHADFVTNACDFGRIKVPGVADRHGKGVFNAE
jgi:hypothetical protein